MRTMKDVLTVDNLWLQFDLGSQMERGLVPLRQVADFLPENHLASWRQR